MDRRRAAGALLALAACIACSAAAPTASDHTALDLYEGTKEGCYYNFQHYGEGDRIMTNEPCLNCTCHNRMLMCYLRVCPFTKPIGQDCTVEKRADQCCPIVTCPDVPVDLLTSTSTSSPAEYGATGLGKLDKYGCSINGKYFPEGSKVPPTPNKPCEHCYCIRNMTTCVMQECTLHVDGCTPIYHKDVCCPVRYSCDHAEDEIPLLDDMSTTTRPTPGFLLTTTTLSVTQMSQDCVHNDHIISDGASITTEKACEHCYCMKGDIVCVVQECGAPMENEGKNCTSLPPREGQCCPDTYICEGDDLSTEISTESVTEVLTEKLTTLSPPRRPIVEGSGYRIEPDKEVNTESSNVELEPEGSGEEYKADQATREPIMPEKPIEITPSFEEGDQYITVSTKAPILEESETSTKDVDKITIGDDIESNTDNPQSSSEYTPVEGDADKKESVTEINNLKPYEPVTVISTFKPETFNEITTEPGAHLNTVSGTVSEQKYEKSHEHAPITSIPTLEEVSTQVPKEIEKPSMPSDHEKDVTLSPTPQVTSSEDLIPSPELTDIIERDTEAPHIILEPVTIKEISGSEIAIETTTGLPTKDKTGIFVLEDTTNIPVSITEKLITEPDHSQNTVAVAEEENIHQHVSSLEEAEKTTSLYLDNISSVTISSYLPASQETATTEPDKGLNTIPSEINEESMQPKPTSAFETKTTEPDLQDTTEQEDDIKLSTGSELSEPEAHVTKGDQYTITTEPSFRKEDKTSIFTEKLQEESERTTIKSEFVDEALIPTLTHDEKLDTTSNIPSIDEYITTIIPDYIQTDLKDTDISGQPATEPDLIDNLASEGVTVKNADTTSEFPVGTQSSTEKSIDVTKEEDSREGPSRIPGEGDCLLNAVTYRNNTIVPSTNKCHTRCKCVSSIIRCDPIICSLPPDNMDSCQSVYDPPDSCCPTYVCDHSRETIPPKSDSQMSGTESPTPSLTIDCRGDQCELSEQTKQPLAPVQPCTSDSCLSDFDKCGPSGCDNNQPIPESTLPSITQSGSASVESCSHGGCQSVPSITPCEGDNCKTTGEELQSLQPCENEAECKKIEMSVSHDTKVPSKPLDDQQISCNGENGCQPQDSLSLDCVGNEPCRRKDVPIHQELPSNCEGSHCKQRPDEPATETTISDETTVYIPAIDTESSKHVDPKVTEQVVTETTQKSQEQAFTPIDVDIATDELILAEGTKAPTHTEQEEISKPTEGRITTKPGSSEEESTKTPIDRENEGLKPNVLEEAHTDKIASTEEDITIIPDTEDGYTDEPNIPIITEDHTDKSVSVKEDSTKLTYVSEEHSLKPTLFEEKDTRIPDYFEEHKIEKEGTTVPTIVEEPSGRPLLEDTPGTIIQDANLEKQTNIPPLSEGTDTTSDTVDKEYDDKPTLIDSHDKGITEPIDNIDINRPTSAEQDVTKIPNISIEEPKLKPELTQDKDTKTPEAVTPNAPDFTSDTQTSEFDIDGDKGVKVPDFVEGETSKPTVFDNDFTKEPDNKYTDRPYIDDKHTVTSAIDDGAYTDSPASIEDHAYTKIPDDVSEEQNNKPGVVLEDGSTTSEITEEHMDKTRFNERTSTNLPDIITDKPDFNEKQDTESTQKFVDRYTEKPNLNEEDKTVMNGDEVKEKPIIVGEELPEKSYDSKDDAEKNAIPEEGTEIPETFEDSKSKKPMVIDESTELSVDDDGNKITKVPYLTEELTNNEVLIDDNIKYNLPTENQGIIEHGTQVPEIQTDSPATDEQHMHTFLPSEIEGSGSEEPEMFTTKVTTKPQEIASMLPETLVENQPVVIGMEPERETNIHLSQTTVSGDIQTDSHLISVDEHLPQVTTENMHHPETPEPEIIESDDKPSKLPGEPQPPEIQTVPSSEAEQEIPQVNIKPSQETINTRVTTISPDQVLSTESETGTLGLEQITKEEETNTELPKQQTVTTPEKVIIEPQEGGQSESPVIIPVMEESTTKIFEDTVKYETPESTLASVEISENEIKSDTPDIFISDKVVTSISMMAVTEPVKASTEIVDTSLTAEQESDTPLKLDEKITKRPDETYSENYQGYTETTIVTETKSSETNAPHKLETSTLLSVDVTTIEPLDVTNDVKPTSSQPPLKTETLDLTKRPDSSRPMITDLPVNVQTETVEKPVVTVGDIISEENITKTPGFSIQPHLDSSTETFDIYITGTQASTGAPESHVTISSEREQPKTTESHIITPDTGAKSEKPQEKDGPGVPIKLKDTEVKATETPLDVQRISTEYSSTIEGMYTQTPQAQITTEAAPSFIDHHQHDLNIAEDQATEKDNTQVHETRSPSEKETTEKIEIVSELTTSKPIKISTEAAYITSSQYGLSETTPYMIELEEHTHRIVGVSIDEMTLSSTKDRTKEFSVPTESLLEDVTTMSPTVSDKYDDEKQYATSSSSIQDLNEAMTPSISIETEKVPVYDSNSEMMTEKISSDEENLLHPGIHIVKDTATESENEIIFSTTKASPVEEEEIMPNSGSKHTGSSVIPTSEPEKISPLDTEGQDNKLHEKPSSETEGTLPPVSEDKYGKPVDTPSSETGETIPPAFEDKEPIEKPSSGTGESLPPASEDKYGKPNGTTSGETGETIPPTFEDKEGKPIEKPSSETGMTSSPVSQDKYSEPDDTLSSDTGETIPPTFEDKDVKPIEITSSETGETLPPDSEDKYGKPVEVPSSETGETIPPAFEDKEGKPIEKPSNDTGETSSPVSKDKYGKPDDTPSSETGDTISPDYENKDGKPIMKPSSETGEILPTISEDKYGKPGDTPSSETGETVPPAFEDKDGKPIEKPSSETGESLPSDSEDKYGKPDDTLSSETGETVPPVFEDKESKPIEKPSSETGETLPPDSEYNYGKPDDITSSGTGETIPPTYEDKEGKPTEKPSSETGETLPPISEDKYGKPDDTPSSETGETVPPIFEDKESKPIEQPSSKPGETLPPDSEDKYGKPDDTPSSETGETVPPVFEDKDSKPVEQPSSEPGETLPPDSEDKYGKPDDTPSSEAGKIVPPAFEDKESKPIEKPSSETGETLPPVSEDKYSKPDDTPSSETGETVPPVFEDKEIKPTKKPSSETGETLPPIPKDKYDKPDDTLSSATVETIPPTYEDKESKPTEKPSSETGETLPPISEDKYGKPDDTPSSETGETVPPVFEDKESKPVEQPSSEPGETLPPISEDKYGKPDDKPSSENGETVSPAFEDKKGKPLEKPSSETGETLPPVSEDKYGKPDDTPNSETGETVPPVFEDKESKPTKKPSSETGETLPPLSEDKYDKPDDTPSSETGETVPPVFEDKESKPTKKPSSETGETLPPHYEDNYSKPNDTPNSGTGETIPPAFEDKESKPIEKPSSETGETLPPVSGDNYGKPDGKPISEIYPPSATTDSSKPLAEVHPTDELPSTDEDANFPPSGTGYGEPDYVEEDQAFGPGTCRYGGKVYVSAQQIPRDDPCDFCFCFRSDIICLQQSCPPPIHGCHEEPIQGFCCPRYECPVSMATTLNVTTTTTTTTTTLPPHFPTHPYKGAAQRRGCQIKGHTYKVGEVVRSASGPCLHCTCGGDGQMKCDPKACTPEPMLRQMIAAAVSAKRRR